jgi:hypothetical protein
MVHSQPCLLATLPYRQQDARDAGTCGDAELAFVRAAREKQTKRSMNMVVKRRYRLANAVVAVTAAAAAASCATAKTEVITSQQTNQGRQL